MKVRRKRPLTAYQVFSLGIFVGVLGALVVTSFHPRYECAHQTLADTLVQRRASEDRAPVVPQDGQPRPQPQAQAHEQALTIGQGMLPLPFPDPPADSGVAVGPKVSPPPPPRPSQGPQAHPVAEGDIQSFKDPKEYKFSPSEKAQISKGMMNSMARAQAEFLYRGGFPEKPTPDPVDACHDPACNPGGFTIFATPKPVVDPSTRAIVDLSVLENQRRALYSWLALRPPPDVIVFGDPVSAGIADLCDASDPPAVTDVSQCCVLPPNSTRANRTTSVCQRARLIFISPVPVVRFKKYPDAVPAPALGDLFRLALRVSLTPTVVFINADVMLPPSFGPAVAGAAAAGDDFLLITYRSHVNISASTPKFPRPPPASMLRVETVLPTKCIFQSPRLSDQNSSCPRYPHPALVHHSLLRGFIAPVPSSEVDDVVYLAGRQAIFAALPPDAAETFNKAIGPLIAEVPVMYAPSKLSDLAPPPTFHSTNGGLDAQLIALACIAAAPLTMMVVADDSIPRMQPQTPVDADTAASSATFWPILRQSPSVFWSGGCPAVRYHETVASWWREAISSSPNTDTERAVDVFAFTAKTFSGIDIPKFAVGRPGYDNWIVHAAVWLGTPVIQAVGVAFGLHQVHGYGHLKGKATSPAPGSHSVSLYHNAGAAHNSALMTIVGWKSFAGLASVHNFNLTSPSSMRRRAPWGTSPDGRWIKRPPIVGPRVGSFSVPVVRSESQVWEDVNFVLDGSQETATYRFNVTWPASGFQHLLRSSSSSLTSGSSPWIAIADSFVPDRLAVNVSDSPDALELCRFAVRKDPNSTVVASLLGALPVGHPCAVGGLLLESRNSSRLVKLVRSPGWPGAFIE